MRNWRLQRRGYYLNKKRMAIVISILMILSMLGLMAIPVGNNHNDKSVSTVIAGATTQSSTDPSVHIYTSVSGQYFILNTSYCGFTYTDDKVGSFTSNDIPTGTIFNVTADPGTGYVFVAWEGSVNSTNRSLNIDVSSNIQEEVIYRAVDYNVTFSEIGLPSETQWYVNISNGILLKGTTQTLTASNFIEGTYTYTISTIEKNYLAVNSGGTFSINGKNMTVNVTFKQSYSVTFTESGLPANTLWFVNLTDGKSFNSTSNYIMFVKTNGTYQYVPGSANKDYVGTVSNRTFSVDGNNASINILFKPVSFNITFNENGLPPGTTWYVNLSNGMKSGKIIDSSYTFSVLNGTYNYTIATSNTSYHAKSGSFNETGFLTGSSNNITYKKIRNLVCSTYIIPEKINVDGFSDTFTGISYNSNSIQINGTTVSTTTTYKIINNQVLVSLTNNAAPGSGTAIFNYKFTANYRFYEDGSYYGPSQSKTYTASSSGFNFTSVPVEIEFSKVTYPVLFTDTGLPSGTTWYVNLSNGQSFSSSTGTISFSESNGSYTYKIATSNKLYRANGGAFTVNGASLSEIATFLNVYSVTFSETGLPSGSTWWVNFNGQNITSSSSTITFDISDGTYSYTVQSMGTYGVNYNPDSSTGTVIVDGFTQTEYIYYYPEYYLHVSASPSSYGSITPGSGWYSSGEYLDLLANPNSGYAFSSWKGTGSGSYSGTSNTAYITMNGPINETATFYIPLYSVTFSETGLPSGSTWYVNITGHDSGPITGSTYTLSLSNNSYTYTVATSNHIYKPSAYSGSVTVNGKSVSVSVTFTQVTYTVTFTEKGLPTGTSWTPDFNGNTYSLTNTSYTFKLTNGTYSYFATSKDYKNLSGSVTVNGANKIVDLSFTLQTYIVTFTETGLPTGTPWYVNLSSGMISGPITESSYSFSLSNGTYTYNIAVVNKVYSLSPSSETFTVNGKDVSESVIFSEIKYNLTVTETGLTSGTSWTFTFNGASYTLTNTSYDFIVENGIYSYSAASKDYKNISGSVIVNGADKAITLSFTLQTYNVTFTETGLPLGTLWLVTLNGTTEHSTTSTILFIGITNGTYSYTVLTVSGYKVSSLTRSITVNGKNVSQSVIYTAITYNVAFTETGLPAGTTWYVNLTNGMESGPITASSYTFYLANGTYMYIPSYMQDYYVANGNFTVHGSSTHISVNYQKEPYIKLSVNPSTSVLSINGANVTLVNGTTGMYIPQGYYYITATHPGYKPYSNMVYLSLNGTYSYNITLIPIKTYGYLTGTVLPGNATVTANGMGLPVTDGYFNVSLAPGTYYVTVTAPGYNGNISVEKITQNRATSLTVTLSTVIKTVTLSGYLSQANASLTVNGMSAYVNSTGYYDISVPSGNVVISAYEPGYYPNSKVVDLTSSTIMNITLIKEPKATSTETVNNTVTSGYDVKITNLTTNNGYISMNYNATINGTITVLLPFNEIRNATISDILSSNVYIDGLLYKNFSITVTSNGSAVLTVYNLAGDPTLYWKYSPDASLPSYYNITFTETGLASGTSWSVTLNGTTESSTASTIVFSELNGTYTYTVNSVSGYTVSPSSGSITVSNRNATQAITFTHNPSKSTPFKLSAIELYAIIGAVIAIAAIGGAAVVIRRRR